MLIGSVFIVNGAAEEKLPCRISDICNRYGVMHADEFQTIISGFHSTSRSV